MKYVKLFEEFWPFSEKFSEEDDKLANLIYVKIEKLDSEKFTADLGPGSSGLFQCHIGDDHVILSSFKDTISINDEVLNCSKNTYNKLLTLFKNKIKEKNKSNKSDLIKKYLD
jgi:hypothetical protein